MSHWAVVVKLPKDPAAKILMEYAPALIFFECDSDIKGIAAFTDQASAQGFREQIASMTTMEVLCIPLRTVEDVRAWCDLLFKFLGPKKYDALPVYIDPPDAYCKGVNIPYECRNLWAFITAKMPEDLHPLLGDVAGYSFINGREVVVLRDQATGRYGALFRASGDVVSNSGLGMVMDYLKDEGTTKEKNWKKTSPVDSIFTAMANAKEQLK